MKKTFTKYIFSSIKQDLSRLISIFVIVVLGLGFLVGLKSTSPDLRATMNQYYNDMNFMDVYIQSTIGFSDSDVETLRSELSGVSQIEGYYQMDEFTYIDNKKSETRLIYRTFENNSIDKITLVDGEFPDNENEVLLLNNSSDTISHKIGTEIRITNDDGTEETYTVSGLVDDPFYISRNGDVTTIGSGVLDAVVYFDSSFYEPKETTIIKIRYAGARQYNSFSQEYKDFIDRKIDEINEISAPFLENRVAEIKEMMKDETAEQIRTQFEEAINNSEFSDEIKQGLIDALEKFLETEEFDAIGEIIEDDNKEESGTIGSSNATGQSESPEGDNTTGQLESPEEGNTTETDVEQTTPIVKEDMEENSEFTDESATSEDVVGVNSIPNEESDYEIKDEEATGSEAQENEKIEEDQSVQEEILEE